MIELAASLSSDTFVTMMGTSAVLLSADPSLALKVNLSVPLKPSLGGYVKAPVSALKPVISPDLGSETMHSVTVVSFLKVSVFPVYCFNPSSVQDDGCIVVYCLQKGVLCAAPIIW